MRKDLVIALLIGTATFSAQAHAYLDAGTGSYVLQMLIAGTLGAALTVKTYWRTIVAKFRSR
jgi:hypothetical protein